MIEATRMTKRQHYTVEDIIDQLSDEDDDNDDPDEPMMEGSDDEFSDLEMDKRDYEDLYGPVNLGSERADRRVYHKSSSWSWWWGYSPSSSAAFSTKGGQGTIWAGKEEETLRSLFTTQETHTDNMVL